MSGLPRGCLDEHLKISHLSDILDDFFDAREKWYYFGLRLKLKVPALESVGASGGDSSGKFMRVLKEVLEGKGCHPVTRSHLVDALEAVTVGLPQLAKELREKYSSTHAVPQVVEVRRSDNTELSSQHSSDDTSDAQDMTSSSSGYESQNGHIAEEKPTLVDRSRITAPPSTDQRFEKLLKRKLRRTRTLYQVLLKRGQESFKRRMVPIPKIAEAAKTYHDQLKLSHGALSKMASMDEVWASFKEYTSWYNSEVVEAVVMLHGDESDQKNLEEFKKDRTNFVRYLGENSDQGEKTQMILKLEEDFNQFSDERLEQVCLTLCDLLETKACPLDVQEGCVKVTVSIPAEVAEDIFPLSPTMEKAFQKVFPTLISVSCGRIVETFETTELEDADESLSLDGQEKCPDEGFNEDEYFADASGSDDEECGKGALTFKKTSKNGTSFLKFWLIATFLSLLLVVAMLSAGLMWPYTSAQWNTSSVDPLEGLGVSLHSTGNCADSHLRDNTEILHFEHFELHSEEMNRNLIPESPGLTSFKHGSWNSSGICYINWSRKHPFLPPQNAKFPHYELHSEVVNRSHVAGSPKHCRIGRGILHKYYSPKWYCHSKVHSEKVKRVYVPEFLGLTFLKHGSWNSSGINLTKGHLFLSLDPVPTYSCSIDPPQFPNTTEDTRMCRNIYDAALTLDLSFDNELSTPITIPFLKLPETLWMKGHSICIAKSPSICCRGCQLLHINGCDTCHKEWSTLVRYIMSMWCGPDIQINGTGTHVSREAGNEVTICLKEGFHSARRRRQMNCYHSSLFLGNISDQFSPQCPLWRRKSRSAVIKSEHSMGTNKTLVCLPKVSSLFADYYPIKSLPNWLNKTSVKSCYVVLPFYLHSFYKSN